MSEILFNFLNPAIVKAYWPALLEGLWVTAMLAFAVVCSGLAAGLALTCLRSLRILPVNFVIVALVDILRALPPLVVIIVVYFGLPFAGIRMSGFAASWLVLAAILAAFSEELFWAGVQAVPRGQWEAARASGLSFGQTMACVILPQALRMTVPPLTSRVIATIKNTALASTVAVPELLARASSALSESGNTTPLTMAAVGYLLILYPLVYYSRRLERRYAWKNK